MSASSTPATVPSLITPPARRAPSAATNDEARQQIAWQREMERAQMATWFKPPVATRSDTAAQAPSTAPPPPPLHASRGVAPRSATSVDGSLPGRVDLPGAAFASAGLPMAGASAPEAQVRAPNVLASAFVGMRTAALAEAAPETRPPADMTLIRRAGGPVKAVGQAMPEGTAEAQTETAVESRLPTAANTEAQAPLRLHEEARPEGQAVWIAMRADDEALAAMLPRIVSDLQRDMQQARGQRLYQVVCNGRLVWHDGAAVAADGVTFIPGGERRSTTVFDSLQSKGA